MKKSLVALLLAVAMLLSVVPAMAYTADILPYDGDPITYTTFGVDLIQENKESEVYKAYMAGLGNVDFQWELVPMSDIDTKNSVYLNSGDIPDVMWTRGNTSVVANYGDMEYWLDLAPYLDEYMPNFKWWLENYPHNQMLYDENGKLYPMVCMDYYDYISEGWVYNKTALEALGYTEAPQTWDEMLKMMKEYKAANPDGMAYVTYAWGTGTYLSYWSYLSDWQTSEWYFNEETQKWDNAIVNPESGYKDLIALMNTLYTEGLIHPEFDAVAQDTIEQYVLAGNWLFGTYYHGTIDNEIFSQGENMPFEYAPMLTPALEEGADRYGIITVRGDGLPGWAYFASAEAEKPELLAAVLDYTLSEEANNLYWWGIEGTSYEYGEDGLKHFINGYGTDADARAALGIDGVYFQRMNFVQDWFAGFEKNQTMPTAQLHQDSLADALRTGVLKNKLSSRGNPSFTLEEGDTIAISKTPMSTYLSEERIKFITGERPMDEWDAFVEEYKSMGNVEEVLSVYDNAQQNIYTNVRNYPDFIIND